MMIKIGSLFQRINYRQTLKSFVVLATIGLLGSLAVSMPAKSATFVRQSVPPYGLETLSKFKFINHSTRTIQYDLRKLLGDKGEHGEIKPGEQFESNTFIHRLSFEYGNISIGGNSADIPAPGVRFWSGNNGDVQYINLLAGNGYTVTKDTVDISEVTGNGIRVTVDGGGVSNPRTLDIYIQVYDH